MPGRVNWYGPAELARIEEGIRRNMRAAAIYLSAVIKADISQAGTLRYYGRTKGGKQSLKSKTVYNFTHSRPGHPPFKQTGRLRASITWELVNLIGRVGTNVTYGRYLELGTRHMAPRPYLVKNLRQHEQALIAILTRTIDSGGLPRTVAAGFRSGHLGAGARKAGYF